jgi:hypothetical protein
VALTLLCRFKGFEKQKKILSSAVARGSWLLHQPEPVSKARRDRAPALEAQQDSNETVNNGTAAIERGSRSHSRRSLLAKRKVLGTSMSTNTQKAVMPRTSARVQLKRSSGIRAPSARTTGTQSDPLSDGGAIVRSRRRRWRAPLCAQGRHDGVEDESATPTATNEFTCGEPREHVQPDLVSQTRCVSDSEHLEKFRTQLEVMKSAGGDICNHNGMMEDKLVRAGVPPAAAAGAETAKASLLGRQRFEAALFLAGCRRNSRTASTKVWIRTPRSRVVHAN